MKVSALTCSTGRPECLELCQCYVERQTRQPDEHVVQEGGDFWQNMDAGLRRCTGDLIVVFEDDDWYDSRWVARCVEELAHCELFGQDIIWNYHAPSGGYETVRPKHNNCPMHATAFRKELTPRVLDLIANHGKHKLDVDVWSTECIRIKTALRYVVSMKGMPGTRGYSFAHDQKHYRSFDLDGTLLASWIGREEAATYQRFRSVP